MRWDLVVGREWPAALQLVEIQFWAREVSAVVTVPVWMWPRCSIQKTQAIRIVVLLLAFS